MLRFGEKTRAILLGGCCLLFSVRATSQEVVQTLDRVAVNSIQSFLEMNFSDPKRTEDFFDTGISGAEFRACRLTAVDGVFCLDGNVVRNWRNPNDPSDFTTVVDCRDRGLNLDAKRADVCSGLAVDSAGAIWIAGRNKAKTHSLMKAVRKPQTGGCPSGFSALSLTDYCAREIATGRPLLIDINSVDGEAAENFTYGAGVLGLEERKTAEFFPVSGPPIAIASGKQGWNLQGSEQLQSIGLLQAPDSTSTSGIRNLVLATTSAGRVLAVNAAGGTGKEVFNIPAKRASASTQCDFNAALYGVRAGAKSGLVYVTDRQFCQVVALQPVMDASGHFSHLTNAKEPVFNASGVQIGMRNLTLSTSAGPSATFPPEGPTVAAGIGIDLSDCAENCTLVQDDDGNPLVTLSGITLDDPNGPSGLTLFQVKNIPDCRYVPAVCRDLLGVQNLVQAGVVIDPQTTGDPAAQLLNVSPMMPREITDLFARSGGLPRLLISRQYRGQKDNGFIFEALFGVAADGVVFRDTFVGEFDVFGLVGSALGCELGLPPNSPLFTSGGTKGTLAWDVVTTVSEHFRTFTDPGIGPAPQHVDTLINFGCGSSRSITGRWSLKPYNLEITPCTFNPNTNDVWLSQGSCPVGGPEVADDAVFAKLLLKIYDDLGAALNQLACVDVDGGGSAPLSAASCSTLQAQWANGKDKLDKCWDATKRPKQSAGAQNCTSFLSQIDGFSSTLALATGGPDPANRRGELFARNSTIRHVYQERFVPSIPAAGFEE